MFGPEGVAPASEPRLVHRDVPRYHRGHADRRGVLLEPSCDHPSVEPDIPEPDMAPTPRSDRYYTNDRAQCLAQALGGPER
jgi:hypothetical protein